MFVQPFPNASEGKWQISTGGGMYPHWRREGKELFYIDSGGRVVAVPVTTSEKFSVGTPRIVSGAVMEFQQFPDTILFDALPDGRGFLVSTLSQAPESASIAVIMNWTSPLKK